MTTPGSESSELVGATLAGRYEVKRLLGRGGMGAVYEAVQQPLGRKVALKVIRRALSDEPSAVKRFTQEAQAVAQLSHPNIVTLFDFGQTDEGVPGAGQLFLAMELLEGRSLERAIRDDGPLPWERALSIVSDVCRALVEAHDKGVIHRDLKPDNVMLVSGREERVKVVDFGVAKLLDQGAGSTMTGTGLVVGTPGYISPEQVNGTNDDPRSDLYALGVMWFEMLTGRAPFEGETPMKVVLRHLHDPAPRPSALASSALPREVDALVQRLLGKTPEARAESAAALLTELSDLIAKKDRLEAEVSTATLSADELRAAAAHAERPPPAAEPPPSPALARPRASLETAPTGSVAPVPPAAPVAPRKKRGVGAWLVGCLVLPVCLLIIGLTLVALVAIKVGPSDPDPPEGSLTVNGVPVEKEAVKAAAAKQLGRLVETAVTGGTDAGIDDVAIAAAYEVALESLERTPNPLGRRAGLAAFLAELEREIGRDDLPPSRRRLLVPLRVRAKTMLAAIEEAAPTPPVEARPEHGHVDEGKAGAERARERRQERRERRERRGPRPSR